MRLGKIQFNAEWRGRDDLASYVLQLEDSEKVSNNFIMLLVICFNRIEVNCTEGNAATAGMLQYCFFHVQEKKFMIQVFINDKPRYSINGILQESGKLFRPTRWGKNIYFYLFFPSLSFANCCY